MSFRIVYYIHLKIYFKAVGAKTFLELAQSSLNDYHDRVFCHKLSKLQCKLTLQEKQAGNLS